MERDDNLILPTVQTIGFDWFSNSRFNTMRFHATPIYKKKFPL